MKVPSKNIPTYDFNTGEWGTRSFPDQYHFGHFLKDEVFKEPGEYQFESFVFDWIKAAKEFEREKKDTGEGRYTSYYEGTEEWEDFWDEEEMKCRLGVLWKFKDRWYYTTRDYYFSLNYCPVINKEKAQEETFISVRDAQYHMMLYEKISEIFDGHSCILKKRQFLFSNLHVAKSLNWMIFENNKRIKWFASDEGYLDNAHGSWSILDMMKTHVNRYTGWSKTYQGEYPEVTQKEKVEIKKGKWETYGNMSSIRARSVKTNPKSGVGGTSWWNWFEEGGIAPKADLTLRYMEPSLVSGVTRVGSFCIGGSVGDLDECKPLKKFLLDPETYGFWGVPTRWYDETGIEKICGLFIPVQYALPEATDQFGNSLVDLALEILRKSEFEGWKVGEMKGNVRVEKAEIAWIKMSPEEYVLTKSQNPKTIKEAFDHRKAPEFNVQKVEKKQDTIKILLRDGELKIKQGLMTVDSEGRPKLKELHLFTDQDRPTEMRYPVDPKLTDKRGVVNIIEDYKEGCEYFAGVDSIESDTTETSDSLFSIHIYRRSYIEKDKNTGRSKVIRGKIVAEWTGRFDGADETNDHGMLLLKMYKAKAACERNKPNFINHCRRNGLSHLITLTKDLPFDKDIDVTGRENGSYGIWRDSAGKVLRELLRVSRDYLNSEVDVIYLDAKEDEDIGIIKKIIRGYDQLELYWTLEELKLWNEDDNFDRADSFFYAIHYGTAEELSFDNKVITVQSEKIDKSKYVAKPAIKKFTQMGIKKYKTTRTMLKY